MAKKLSENGSQFTILGVCAFIDWFVSIYKRLLASIMGSKEEIVDNHHHDPFVRKDHWVNGGPVDMFEPAAGTTLDASELFFSSSQLCQSMHGGSGMVMYMDGFHWTYRGGLNSSSEGLPCLNILYPSYTIRTNAQLCGVMIAVFIWAILTEAISKFRHALILRLHQRHRSSSASSSSLCFYIYYAMYRNRTICLPLLHGLHAFMGYILMLIVMTYSIELFMSVIAGLMVGYLVFRHPSTFLRGDTDRRDDTTESNESTAMITDVQQLQRQQHQWFLERQWSATSSNPCCDFLDVPN
jgi:hypothetical protein